VLLWRFRRLPPVFALLDPLRIAVQFLTLRIDRLSYLSRLPVSSRGQYGQLTEFLDVLDLACNLLCLTTWMKKTKRDNKKINLERG
jgi:hypothetical protein